MRRVNSILNRTVYGVRENWCRDMNLDLRAGYGIRSMPTTIYGIRRPAGGMQSNMPTTL